MLLLTQSFIPEGTQVSRHGTDFVHLMDILLATLLTCKEAEGIIDKVASSDPVRTELIEVLKMSSEKGCEWDAKAD